MKKKLMKQIKEMEDKARQDAAAAAVPVKVQDAKDESPQKVDLDTWFFLRSKQIPGHHMKEIIAADFKGRGLSTFETIEDFDKALASYGVKIK